MKTNLFFRKLSFGIAMTLLISGSAKAGHLTDQFFFSARMDGAQQVPAVSSNGKGVAGLVLNATRDTLCVSIYMSGISEAITGIHIHNGMAGSTGGVALDLSGYLQGYVVKAQITGADLSATLIENMFNGGLYINAHTATNANGEIRGQIKLETDYAARANLTTDQQVNMPVSSATGVASLSLSTDLKNLRVMVVANNLSSALTGAHIHYGKPGVDGPVAVNLSSLINGSVLQGNVDISSMPELRDSIRNGSAYLNLHTTNNAGGEIRGQLNEAMGIHFDTWLDTMQEVTTPMMSMGIGTGYFVLSPQFDMLTFAVQLDGLTGAIEGAHFHNAAINLDGPVLTDLTSMVNGMMISGTLSAAQLTDELITELLEGNIYLNVHTAMNMAGEVRGQVYRLAREGYMVDINGDQQVPSLSTNAYGGGIVSVNRDQTNVHYMLVAGELSGMLQGAHFHNAVAGANGGVIYDLSPSFSNMNTYDAAFGYWSNMDATAFTSTEAAMFRSNSVYVNLHTMTNANGEIRGQVVRGAACESTVLSAETLENDLTVQLYPNPAVQYIRLNAGLNQVNQVRVTDLSGKSIEVSYDVASGIIDCSGLHDGIYLVHANVNGVVISKRLVLVH